MNAIATTWKACASAGKSWFFSRSHSIKPASLSGRVLTCCLTRNRPISSRFLFPDLAGYCRWLLVVFACFVLPVAAETSGELGHSRGERLLVDTYSNEYDDLFRYYSKLYFGPFVDWRWFKAQAIAESRLNSVAKSSKGAAGIMQILPATFDELRALHAYSGDILDPEINIAAGMMYDRELFRKWNRFFKGRDRLLLTLASYNAGFYRVYATYRSVPKVRQWDDLKASLPNETRSYLRRIRELMQPVEVKPEPLIASLETDMRFWPVVSLEMPQESQGWYQHAVDRSQLIYRLD